MNNPGQQLSVACRHGCFAQSVNLIAVAIPNPTNTSQQSLALDPIAHTLLHSRPRRPTREALVAQRASEQATRGCESVACLLASDSRRSRDRAIRILPLLCPACESVSTRRRSDLATTSSGTPPRLTVAQTHAPTAAGSAAFAQQSSLTVTGAEVGAWELSGCSVAPAVRGFDGFRIEARTGEPAQPAGYDGDESGLRCYYLRANPVVGIAGHAVSVGRSTSNQDKPAIIGRKLEGKEGQGQGQGSLGYSSSQPQSVGRWIRTAERPASAEPYEGSQDWSPYLLFCFNASHEQRGDGAQTLLGGQSVLSGDAAGCSVGRTRFR
ncbi:hypothetical protein L1887_59124 [Cichorium endivia]|nr:hypothetical protein L1887_59124 [Cichorium endivia]